MTPEVYQGPSDYCCFGPRVLRSRRPRHPARDFQKVGLHVDDLVLAVALGGDGNDNVDGGATNGDTVSGGAGRNVVRGLRSEINEAFTDSAAWLDLLNA